MKESTKESIEFYLIAAVVIAASIWLVSCGGGPTTPTPPPPAKVCTLVHHEASCTTIFTPTGPVLQCTPAHDGPDETCQ